MTRPTQALVPVEAEPEAKRRHDAFDGKRKRDFLDALGKGGCLRDAARRAGVSHQTVYNHQRSDKEFARQCELALDMASTDVELHAWERGVKGVEEPIVYRGEIIGTRLKRSDAILRLLLQGTKRKKYGPNPGFGRKRLHKIERKRIKDEVRAELRVEQTVLNEEVEGDLRKQLDALGVRVAAENKAKGWTRAETGHWIPPGWVRADAVATPGEQACDRGEQAPDSV